MEESGEQCTVVFAWIITEPASGGGGPGWGYKQDRLYHSLDGSVTIYAKTRVHCPPGSFMLLNVNVNVNEYKIRKLSLLSGSSILQYYFLHFHISSLLRNKIETSKLIGKLLPTSFSLLFIFCTLYLREIFTRIYPRIF